MSKIFLGIKNFIHHYPAILLLLFVYLFLIPRGVSYRYAWAIPEIQGFDITALKTGTQLNLKDLGNGLNYKGFENGFPRITRPLSSYFQILDTKFRCWLWHYIPPHPSLSLTWIFTLGLAPLFLYYLLCNLGISSNTAVTMAAFYLLTPTSMSHVAELFRPAKPMTDFAIIFCLYFASFLQKKYLQQNQLVPWKGFILFWIISAVSFFWDETALLIFPAIFFVFPKVITHRRPHLFLWLLLPFITALFYFSLIPYLTSWAGYGHPDLSQYFLYRRGIKVEISSNQANMAYLFGQNTKNLVLYTMGLIMPSVLGASAGVKFIFGLGVIGWGIVLFYLSKVRKTWVALSIFLLILILYFNHLMSIQWPWGAWGPFYYGGFWSIFFTIWLARVIDKSAISKILLVFSFFLILINMFQAFSAVDIVYKKYHYYPYRMGAISSYFDDRQNFFSQNNIPVFSEETLKDLIKYYWMLHKTGITSFNSFLLPVELHWMVLELDPQRQPPFKPLLFEKKDKFFIDTLPGKTKQKMP